LTKFDLLPEHYSERSARQWLHWQAQLDAPDPMREIRTDRRPAPKPPVAARPRRLSVTQIETWMRDPYAIYARHILKLRELDPIDAAPDHADYGTIIHRILDEFIRQHPQNLPFDAYEQLSALGAEKFAERSVPPGVRAFWWPRFLRIARWIADTEPERRNGLVDIASEVTGEMSIDGPAGPFRVTAIADRIDRMDDGSLQIFDYKTGTVPKATEVIAGFAPQLPLEAMIAMAGGFTGIKGGDISKLAFLRLSGGNPAGEEKPAASKETDPRTLAKEAREGLIGLVASFDREDTPYEARPRPDMAPRYSAYEHLARVKEWAAGNDGEGGET
jgi:ATP-dependent helicase/nuclease subunit B